MKTLMITAATSALMLGMAACSQPAEDMETADSEYDQSETADTTNGVDMAEDDGNLMDAENEAANGNMDVTYLASGELSADNLIGAEVIGADGEQVAVVDDLLLNSSGQVDSLIFRAGDILDAAGAKGAIAFSEVDLAMMDGDEPRFSVSMTDEAIQNVAEFDQEGLNDYRLASEMIGTTAGLMNDDGDARIEDIVIDSSGAVQYVVITDPAMMDEMRVLGFDRVSVGGENNEIVVDAAADEISQLPLFEYQDDMNADMSGSDEMDMTDETDTGMTDSETDMTDDEEMTTPK